ncbi:MAG: hypothetical protein WC977_02065 [Anaerovoracaceae bacterium]|jgi:hypothetical protein
MNVPRQPSRPDDDPPSGGGNGNGNGGDHDDDLGQSLQPCKLGDDCPYAGSMRWLFDERLKREQTEGQIVSRVDILSDKLKAAILLVEKFERMVLDLQFEFNKHKRTHRLFELAVLALAAGAGGFFARWIGGK